MSQEMRAEEPLEQGPVEDAGPRSEQPPEAEVIDGVEVEEITEAEAIEVEEAEVEIDPRIGGETQPRSSIDDSGDAESAEARDEPIEPEAEAKAEVAEAEPEETPLEQAERERGEYLELAQRSRAEFENFRKRAALQAAEAENRGKADLARHVMPALDNLERALGATGFDPASEGEGVGEEADAFAGGVALVLKELQDGLRAAGVEGFDPTGERFDPTQHEAIATGQAEGIKSGIVIETMGKGYRIGEQVLRPARVVVAG